MLPPEQQELARRAAHHEARTAEQEAAERAERLEDRAFVPQREGKGRTHQAVLEDRCGGHQPAAASRGPSGGVGSVGLVLVLAVERRPALVRRW
jgi:hypothetical protein